MDRHTTSSAEPRPKQEHTPGPWAVSMSDPTLVYSKKPEGTGRWVCSSISHPVRNREDEANARLIAAAPDLLAAAKRAEYELRDAVHIFKLDGMTSFAKAAEQAADFASKAIARAEGRV
jgi:hypothetical protein